MTDLKEIELFLGIRITRTENSIEMDQEGYINTVLAKYNMDKCKPKLTPLDQRLNNEAMSVNDNFCEKYPIRQALGSLMYIMLATRPDICAAVIHLSKFQNNNNMELWTNIKAIFRYLKGTSHLKLKFKRDLNSDILHGFVDASFAGCTTDKSKSTTGFCFMSHNSTICWATKRQSTVASSSTEAEYMALFEAIKEAIWLKQLLQSIHIDINFPITIFEDNQPCIDIANNPVNNNRSKHFDIKYHYSRERIIDTKDVVLVYISTDEQVADILTKNTSSNIFLKLRKQIGME